MRLSNFIVCSLLQVFIGSLLFQYIACDCEFPDNDEFLNGKIIYQSPSDVNETYAKDLYMLQFECNRGFQLIGRRFAQCIDEEWEPEIPFCAVNKCSEPPKVGNATYEVKSVINRYPVVGSYAEYTCNEGYEFQDKQAFILRCVWSRNSKGAVWAGETPFCKEIILCPDPGESKFGSRAGNCCLAGSSVEFECDEGYELVGEDIIHCLPLGNWTALRPLCKPFKEHCELPPRISHGIIIGDKEGDYYLPYDEAQILCEPGYKCEGPEFVLCEEGGEWESEFGECKEVFCDPPPPLDNGTILELQSTNLTILPFKFELTYVCNQNYRLIGESWRICGKRGAWTGKNPTCEVTQCPDPGVPENGFRMGDKYTVGSVVRFGCFEGYELVGSLERYCLTNGQWSGELPRCDLPTNYCPNPGIPIKGSKNSTNYDLGSIIVFHCRDGYSQLGSEARECLVDHTWSGMETKCLGRYHFDSEASIKEKLINQIIKIAEKQQMELCIYRRFKEHLRQEIIMGLPQPRIYNSGYPKRVILYFMFDVSGSFGRINFRRGIEFAKAIVNKVGISELGARAGALTFGSRAEGMFLPIHYDTTQDVLNALDGIEYRDGTDTSSVFTLLRRDYIPLVEEMIGRVNVKSIIFVITDGKVNMGGYPKMEAEILKRAGIDIYCIGITGDVRTRTLYNIASKSKNERGVEYSNVYILRNFATLSWLAQEITNGTIDYSECGLGVENVGNRLSRRRIIDGRDSKDPWPWMAALFMRIEKEIPPKYELECGGSIIHRNFILTAAHCFYKDLKTNPVMRDKKSVIIKLGLTDQKSEDFVQESEILNVFIHPKYRPGNLYDYDIALLQMERPAEYNPYVRPICLPPRELPDDSPLYKPKSSAWAIGWGHIKKVSKYGIDDLRSTENFTEIYLPIQSKEKCVESINFNGVDPSLFTDHMFCAGEGTGGNNTCQGDSGGPLMQAQINDEGYIYWTQVGIVSWCIQCGLPNTYGYYTYLQRLVPWVEDTIDIALKDMGV